MGIVWAARALGLPVEARVGVDLLTELLAACEREDFRSGAARERRHFDVIDTRGIWQDMPMRT